MYWNTGIARLAGADQLKAVMSAPGARHHKTELLEYLDDFDT
jgi:hypothetical protein